MLELVVMGGFGVGLWLECSKAEDRLEDVRSFSMRKLEFHAVALARPVYSGESTMREYRWIEQDT